MPTVGTTGRECCKNLFVWRISVEGCRTPWLHLAQLSWNIVYSLSWRKETASLLNRPKFNKPSLAFYNALWHIFTNQVILETLEPKWPSMHNTEMLHRRREQLWPSLLWKSLMLWITDEDRSYTRMVKGARRGVWGSTRDHPVTQSAILLFPSFFSWEVTGSM